MIDREEMVQCVRKHKNNKTGEGVACDKIVGMGYSMVYSSHVLTRESV